MKLNSHDQNTPGNAARPQHEIGDMFDFIICGAGSSGSVVAARLAEDGNAGALLLEAGGDDAAETVTNPAQWPLNLGSSRDWSFVGQPALGLDGRYRWPSHNRLLDHAAYHHRQHDGAVLGHRRAAADLIRRTYSLAHSSEDLGSA